MGVCQDITARPLDQLLGLAAPSARPALAFVLTELGRETDALAGWERARGRLLCTAPAHRALLHARAGRRAEAGLALAAAAPEPAHRWDACVRALAAAVLAEADGRRDDAVAEAERALGQLPIRLGPRGPVVAAWLAPLLDRCGEGERAGELLAAALQAHAACGAGQWARFRRGRLLAVRAALSGGDRGAALDEACRAAGDAAHHLLVAEWRLLEPLLTAALQDSTLADGALATAVARACRDGRGLAVVLPRAAPAVAARLLPAALAAGLPDAPIVARRLLEGDDPRAVAGAAAAVHGARCSPPVLAYHVFGGFRVRRGSWWVSGTEWQRPMAARLIRFLLAHRAALAPEDLLFEALWPNRPPAAARRCLAVSLSQARAVVDPLHAEPSAIEAVDHGYRLVLRSRDTVDADIFEAAVNGAIRATGPDRRALLEYAAAVWGGDPLPEDRYADWASGWRERLTDRRREVLCALGEIQTADGDHFAALRTARRALEADPLDEAAHRRVMSAHAALGQTRLALEQFLRCRSALVEHLGIEPSTRTAELQARILCGEAPVRAA
jgi:DNA-binding SARP family transcriptional activator